MMHRPAAATRRAPALRSTVAAAAAAVLLAACSDSTGPAADSIDPQISADVAAAAADAAREDVEVLRVNVGGLGLGSVDYERFARWSPCPFDAGTGRFTCAPATRGPWTTTRSYQFLDAAGQPQSAYDASLTASANFRWTVAGDIDRGRWSATSARARELTFTGLAGAESQVTVNGTGSDARNRTRFANAGRTGDDRSYDMAATLRVENVILPVPRFPGAWPTSGTVTRAYTGTRTGPNGTRIVQRTSVVTFNGTSTVPLTVNDRRFTLDLTTGEITEIAAQ